MNISEKRKKWLTKKVILNTIHVSAGIFTIASVFQIAQIFIDGSETIELRVFSAILSITITTLLFLISGLINPDFMEIVFRMLGFKEENEASPENSSKEKCEKKDEKNDFSKLVDEFFVEENKNKEFKEDLKATLKVLYEKRLDFHSQSLITGIKLSVSIIMSVLTIILTAITLFTGDLFFSLILVGFSIVFFAITEQTITKRKNKKEDEEREIARQYLEVIAELDRTKVE